MRESKLLYNCWRGKNNLLKLLKEAMRLKSNKDLKKMKKRKKRNRLLKRLYQTLSNLEEEACRIQKKQKVKVIKV